jgi:general secretion pathway protein G
MDHRKQTKTRLAIASLVGIMIIGVCLNVTWKMAGSQIRYSQIFTQRILTRIDTAIKEYRRQKGVLPQSLSQLSNVPVRDNGAILDSWKHPLIYEVHKDGYTLMSYGRDGKPGGVGLDCDLSSAGPRPATAALPFLQVMFHPMAQRMVWTSIVSGIFAFLLIFDMVTPVDLSQRRWVELTFKILMMLIAACIVAVAITMLHVPSGH